MPKPPLENSSAAADISGARNDIRKLADAITGAFKTATADGHPALRAEYRAKAEARMDRYLAALAAAPGTLGWTADEIDKNKAALRHGLNDDRRGKAEPAQQVYYAAVGRLSELRPVDK